MNQHWQGAFNYWQTQIPRVWTIWHLNTLKTDYRCFIKETNWSKNICYSLQGKSKYFLSVQNENVEKSIEIIVQENIYIKI